MNEVTVILPLYNEKKEYVVLAVESILKQTFQDFVLYIILDNPKNEELQILIEEYEKKESKISFFINEENMRLPETLNKAIDMVKTEFIARMDGDDISFPKRLEVQRNFMKTHQDIDLCSVNIQYIDESGNLLKKNERFPENPKNINRCLNFLNVLVHPGFFVKTSVMKKMKYRNLKYAQDYDLICRMAESGYRMANINQYLLYYRIGNNTDRKIVEQWKIAKIVRTYYKKKKLCCSDVEKDVQIALSSIRCEKDIKQYIMSNKYYERGVGVYRKKGNKVQGILFVLKKAILSKMYRDNLIETSKYRIFMKTHPEHN